MQLALIKQRAQQCGGAWQSFEQGIKEEDERKQAGQVPSVTHDKIQRYDRKPLDPLMILDPVNTERLNKGRDI